MVKEAEQPAASIAFGSSYHTNAKTNASTCDVLNQSTLRTPNQISRRQEFSLIKSNEKDALFLSERYGERLDGRPVTQGTLA